MDANSASTEFGSDWGDLGPPPTAPAGMVPVPGGQAATESLESRGHDEATGANVGTMSWHLPPFRLRRAHQSSGKMSKAMLRMIRVEMRSCGQTPAVLRVKT